MKIIRMIHLQGERGVCVETQSDLEINSPVGNFVF